MSRDLSAHIGYPQQLVELLMLIATAPADGGDDLELVDAETIPAAASASLTRAGLREVWNSHLSAWPDPPADVTLVSQLLNAAGMDREAVVDWLSARAPTKDLASASGRKRWRQATALERELASGLTIGVLPLAHPWYHYTDGGGLVVSAQTRRDPAQYREVLERDR